jgi:glycosyltransferase involved in cell wall biosynthesis
MPAERGAGYIIAHNASPIVGGGETWLARFLAGMQQRGHRSLFLCRNDRVAKQAEQVGVPARVLVLGGNAMFSDAFRFARLLRSEHPDALLLTTFSKTWLGGIAGRLSRVPRVAVRVGALPRRPGARIYRIALGRWIDAIVLNADTMRGPMIAALPSVRAEKFVTIHDGIALEPSTRTEADLHRELGIHPDTPLIGSLGRLVKQKRYDRLIGSMAQLPRDVHLVIAGDGADKESLIDLARSLGIDDRVHLIGWREDTAAILKALDVFVVSSDFEGMANVMLEAMAVGIPVVSTRVSGAEEALAASSLDGPTPGIVVGFEQHEISDAVSRLLADPSLRARMGKEGIRRVRDHFSFERMLDEWEGLFWSNFQS